jgi:hypothetical protein
LPARAASPAQPSPPERRVLPAKAASPAQPSSPGRRVPGRQAGSKGRQPSGAPARCVGGRGWWAGGRGACRHVHPAPLPQPSQLSPVVLRRVGRGCPTLHPRCWRRARQPSSHTYVHQQPTPAAMTHAQAPSRPKAPGPSLSRSRGAPAAGQGPVNPLAGRHASPGFWWRRPLPTLPLPPFVGKSCLWQCPHPSIDAPWRSAFSNGGAPAQRCPGRRVPSIQEG